MKIKILVVGKIKEKWYAEALAEYVKRLDRFAAVEIFEADEGDVRDMGEASVNAALKKEAEQILPRLQGYTVALDIDGRQMSSTEIASLIHREKMNNSVFTFVVGGSHGLHRERQGRGKAQAELRENNSPAHSLQSRACGAGVPRFHDKRQFGLSQIKTG